tara:strand:- start:74 stop:328 length:255 start_codon:yes stop_codon:yes gene_type:complete
MTVKKQNSNQKADSATGVRGRADLSAASRLQDQRQGAVIEDRYVPLSSGELIEGPTAVQFESPDLKSKQADVGSFLFGDCDEIS